MLCTVNFHSVSQTNKTVWILVVTPFQFLFSQMVEPEGVLRPEKAKKTGPPYKSKEKYLEKKLRNYYKPILCFIILGIMGAKRLCTNGIDLEEILIAKVPLSFLIVHFILNLSVKTLIKSSTSSRLKP